MKSIETDTAKIIFSGYEIRQPSGTTALTQLEEATDLLSGKMVSAILDQWKKDVYESGSFQLTLTGANYKAVSKFKEALNNIRGINQVFTRSFQGGIAIIEVRYRGTSDDLADKLTVINTIKLEIVGVQANTIEIKFLSEM